MREETDQQQNDLLNGNERDFVRAVRDNIVNANPEFGADPALLDRLASAYDEAKRIGLSEDELLVKFLYLEMQVPGFYRQPVISTWLEKPGAPIDGRFKDLLDVLRKKTEDGRGDR
ncbi:hypothetical protein [Trinickia sp. EG282A]|uniref:hypothetical protein n=1 Tax=Trinickia sp. EG282A TaxID=3237013 RepID=UPI0034D37C0E